MTITNIETRPDGGFYATLNGRDTELTGGEGQDDPGHCDCCQREKLATYSDGINVVCIGCIIAAAPNHVARRFAATVIEKGMP